MPRSWDLSLWCILSSLKDTHPILERRCLHESTIFSPAKKRATISENRVTSEDCLQGRANY